MTKVMKTERVPIMFDRELLHRLDEYSFSHRIRTRAEAIRGLVKQGIERTETPKTARSHSASFVQACHDSNTVSEVSRYGE